MERTDYRPTLELLKEVFPGRVTLTMPEVCAYLRRDRRTLLKDRAFPAQMVGGKYAISIVRLARYLS